VVLIVLNSSEQADQEIIPCLTTFKFFKVYTISTPSPKSSFFRRHTPDGNEILSSGYRPGFASGMGDERPLFRCFLMGAGHIPFVIGDALSDFRVNDPGLCRLGIMFEPFENNSLFM
jgi:hypothetical protein